MPLELRKIQFTPQELQTAAVQFCLSVGRPMPQTTLVDLAVRNDPNTTLVLRFAPGPPELEESHVTMSRTEVVEALVQFCLKLRIPLPRRGKKVLWHFEDGIALMVTLNIETDARESSNHQTISA